MLLMSDLDDIRYGDPSDWYGEPPDLHPEAIELEKIPRRLWEQTLAPLHRQQRNELARHVRDERLNKIAWQIADDLDLADMERAVRRQEARGRALRQTAASLPSANERHATTRPTVQVNIRLRADDYARLADAARSVALRPTTLARALVLNGAAQVLRDAAT
jgi:hypothetical protein